MELISYRKPETIRFKCYYQSAYPVLQLRKRANELTADEKELSLKKDPRLPADYCKETTWVCQWDPQIYMDLYTAVLSGCVL